MTKKWWFLFLCFISFLASVFLHRNPVPLPLIVLGSVSETAIRVLVLGPAFEPLGSRLELVVTDGVSRAISQRILIATGKLNLQITGLLPAHRYELSLSLATVDAEAMVGPASTFRTSPIAGSSASFSFSFGSCLWSHPLSPHDGLVEMASLGTDFAVLLGDSVYLDLPVSLPARTAYQQLFSSENFRRLAATTPVFTVFDDHEVANDWDLGRSAPLGRESLAVWDEYFGFRNPTTSFYTFEFGRASFFALDTRSFRSRDSPKSILGAEQRQALADWFASAPGEYLFVLSSVPFSSSVHQGDGWRLFEDERQQVLELSRKSCVAVTVLSGDLHWAFVEDDEVSGVQEISASPIRSFPLPVSHVGSPAFASGWKWHVGTVEVSDAGAWATIRAASWTSPFQEVHRVRLRRRLDRICTQG